MQDFGQSGNGQKILPTAIFLIGYCIGPIVFSPLSEIIGRRPVLFWSFTVFFLGTIACAFAPNWPSLLVFRVICGTMAAAPQTVVGGVYADLFEDLRTRGRAMALYMAVCLPRLKRTSLGVKLIIIRLLALGQSLGPSYLVALSSMAGAGLSAWILSSAPSDGSLFCFIPVCISIVPLHTSS